MIHVLINTPRSRPRFRPTNKQAQKGPAGSLGERRSSGQSSRRARLSTATRSSRKTASSLTGEPNNKLALILGELFKFFGQTRQQVDQTQKSLEGLAASSRTKGSKDKMVPVQTGLMELFGQTRRRADPAQRTLTRSTRIHDRLSSRRATIRGQTRQASHLQAGNTKNPKLTISHHRGVRFIEEGTEQPRSGPLSDTHWIQAGPRAAAPTRNGPGWQPKPTCMICGYIICICTYEPGTR